MNRNPSYCKHTFWLYLAGWLARTEFQTESIPVVSLTPLRSCVFFFEKFPAFFRIFKCCGHFFQLQLLLISCVSERVCAHSVAVTDAIIVDGFVTHWLISYLFLCPPLHLSISLFRSFFFTNSFGLALKLKFKIILHAEWFWVRLWTTEREPYTEHNREIVLSQMHWINEYYEQKSPYSVRYRVDGPEKHIF